MGFVPKKQPNKYRMIVDLSQPEGNSVNLHIENKDAQVQYPSVQDAVDVNLALREQWHSPFLAKVDIKSAFRLLTIAQSHFPLMGLKFDEKYYIDLFLPMGSRSSCRIFEEFSNAVPHIVHTHGNVPHVINYLNDYLLIGQSQSHTSNNLSAFKSIASPINLPLAPEKIEGPAAILTFLGIELNCDQLMSRLPQDKIDKAKNLISSFLVHKKAPRKKLSNCTGF